ncbi:MAG: hypothetical protein A2527_08160 [Candidatus Lambdaproteobacteria bacterium RIFOXYD2_FULL_50_16]|uniref:Uncharacterized protein n=1 Tax=Candidatus Lambdaproteobacteria bacterium RIFOXYD2_FULL_50_16 TaxID=1817772 RepID=A0A1F6GAJ6_9PROT|nr:MAG: hypothetical protein A2527_08160 [Candidatus Lambdaproteobacteria bacterium RIFOXYD2_FULL_50_16]
MAVVGVCLDTKAARAILGPVLAKAPATSGGATGEGKLNASALLPATKAGTNTQVLLPFLPRRKGLNGL